jgi:hypothetical protein
MKSAVDDDGVLEFLQRGGANHHGANQPILESVTQLDSQSVDEIYEFGLCDDSGGGDGLEG